MHHGPDCVDQSLTTFVAYFSAGGYVPPHLRNVGVGGEYTHHPL